MSDVNRVKIRKGYTVLFVASGNSATGGAFRSMVALCKLLQSKYGIRPVIVLKGKGGEKELLGNSNIKMYYIRSYSWCTTIERSRTARAKLEYMVKRLLNIRAIFYLKKIIKKEKVDLIHINTIYSYVGAKAALCTGKPFVWHLREVLDEDQNSCFYDDRDWSLINRANKVICISDFVKKKFWGKLDHEKACVISNGICEEDYFSDKAKFEGSITKFLCVGNMSFNKGQDYVISAAHLLKESNVSGFHISFVGEGANRGKYEEQVEQLGLGEVITFYDECIDVSKFYSDSDVFIMASDAEAFGRVTVEAMLGGCLIIGTDHGGTPEILDDGRYGIMFSRGDAVDLASKMISVINGDRKALAKMAKEGQMRALEKYNARQNAKAIFDVYSEVVANK